jgi:hypothetical protein
MSEASELNNNIIQLGNARGGMLWRNNTGRRGGVSFGKVGSGDDIGIYHGYFISIETKTPNDRASKAQIDFMEDVRYHGGFACFARSLDDAIEFFDMIDKFEAERNGAQVIPF